MNNPFQEDVNPVPNITAAASRVRPSLSLIDLPSSPYPVTRTGATRSILPSATRLWKPFGLKTPSSFVRIPQKREWAFRRGESFGILRASNYRSIRLLGRCIAEDREWRTEVDAIVFHTKWTILLPSQVVCKKRLSILSSDDIYLQSFIDSL